MDPRFQALKEYFSDLEVEHHGVKGKIVKINTFPNAEHFFLTVEDLVELAGLNAKYKDYYIEVNEFCTNLCEGKYSVGSGMSSKLKSLHERVKELEDELNFKIEMEENLIEEDMNNVKDMVMHRIEEYFTELKAKLRNMFHANNSGLKESLVEANKILKQELLNTLNEAEFFDINKFFVQFEELKKKPDDFEHFLKSYLNNDKALQFSKDMNKHLESLSPIFNDDFDIDSKMSNYVLNIEKLSHHYVPQEDDMVTVLEGFSKAIVKQIDSTMTKARHFTVGEALVTEDYKQHSPQKSVEGGSTIKTPRKTTGKKSRPTNEIHTIRFKNSQDLQYDFNKFANSSVNTVVLEMHGNSMTQKSCEQMSYFLKHLYRLDNLELNFSM